jgi:arylsulfatase A-like enzyme
MSHSPCIIVPSFRAWISAVLFAAMLFVPACSSLTVAAEARRPNVIFILADDLGYGDLGCFGQKKIRTPHLDRLAAEGMRFTQHYAGNAVCAPSRCVLLTGKHPGHAHIRDNREVRPEGQPPLPAGTVTLARLLQREGYATGAFGKWGLGFPGSEGEPLRQGFDRFYGYNCQRHAHNYYPTSLWDNTRRVPLNNPAFAAHQKLPDDADARDPASYARYQGRDYAPDLILEQALRFVREHQDRPFFLYFATTVPHLALQVPDDSLAEYRGQFDDTPYTGGSGYLPHLAPRAAYAAMVSRLDRAVGRLAALVRELGLDAHTLFVFTSDNGPLYDKLGGTDTEFFNSAAGRRGRKGSLYEGGVRVPLIVRWPGRLAAGQTSDRVTGFEDWLPTILELIGAPDKTPAGVDGISFAPTLLGRPQPPRPFLYREFPSYGGWQSVRVGDWKALRRELNPRNAAAAAPRAVKTELYNLRDDPAETRDVAAEHPEQLARLERLLAAQHTRSELFPLRALDR